MAKEIETELRKSFETLVENEENHCSSNNKSKTKIPVKSFARPMFNKRARDDPKCPSEFKFESLACTEAKVAQKLPKVAKSNPKWPTPSERTRMAQSSGLPSYS